MNEKSINIAIIGLGYVGLPLAIEFSKKYNLIGFDKDQKRIIDLTNCVDKTREVSKEELLKTSIKFTSDHNEIQNCNVYIVTVPTPVDKYKQPDMNPLSSASRIVGGKLQKNDIVIYESTVYPGATEEFCVPILENESNLIYGKDFFCGYSPERINPGDKKHTLKNIIKVTSGTNKRVSTFVDKLYKSIISAGTYMVSSIAVAEACKVIENTQRDVNIALINELSMIFNKLNIDTNEVIDASSTKWNFLPFKPGLVGGHCIGVDPYYLTHKAIEIGINPEMILAGRRINDSMGKYLADHTIAKMKDLKINISNARIAIFGLTFKENCPDLRNTQVPDLINKLDLFGSKIYATDPYANSNEAKSIHGIDLVDKSIISNIDVAVLAVAHDEYKRIQKEDWLKMFNSKVLVVDIKSLLPRDFFTEKNIFHWRL